MEHSITITAEINLYKVEMDQGKLIPATIRIKGASFLSASAIADIGNKVIREYFEGRSSYIVQYPDDWETLLTSQKESYVLTVINYKEHR